jgi:hypothetical protein
MALRRAISLCSTKLQELEAMDRYFGTPTGNSVHDVYHQRVRSLFCSPDSSGLQEQVLADAVGSLHKGSKKLGADAVLDGAEVEIKPCKSEKPVGAVNITDDQPTRLIKDLQTPDKLLVIGRCPGGLRFRWVVVCPMTDFAPHRYTAMCRHWNHDPEPWPASLDEQIKVVERLAEKRTKNNYLRSSQLKFVDIQTILASWVHPDINPHTLTRRSEDVLLRRLTGTQTSAPPTVSSHPAVPVLEV